jgi:hypothetical protein
LQKFKKTLRVLKFIAIKIALLVFHFAVVQFIYAKTQAFELNANAVNTVSHNIPKSSKFPDNKTTEEHSEIEELSENEMLFTNKITPFCVKPLLVKKTNKNNTTKPSNESLGIVIPPPKA